MRGSQPEMSIYPQSLATNQAEKGQVNDDPSSPIGHGPSTEPLSNRDSSISYPFDSQSSLENVSGSHAKRKSLFGRILDTLHLSKSYLPGYVNGEVDQIIHSRKSPPHLLGRQADAFIAVNEYCSGYGKVAAVENLDPDFLIYRKFGWLRNYALLHLQDELAALQDELTEFDKWEFRDGDPKQLVSRRLDYERPDSRRKEIMAAVHRKLEEYDEALLRAQKIQAIKRPSPRSQRNVHNLIHNTESLVSDEVDWIREGPDLAAIGCPADRGWLNNFLENALNTISRTATRKLFRTHEQKIKSGDEVLHLVSLDRLDNVLRAVVTIIAAVLLLVPVFVLFKLQPTNKSELERKSNYQIITIFLFTLLFSASCSIFTQAKKQEVFTATAAYSAVLVVFLGNTSNVFATIDN